MFRRLISIVWAAIVMLLLFLIGGCDDRATQIAREAADRQAQQNTTMAKLHEEVAKGSQHLVTADAAARQDVLKVHHELQAERSRLDTWWGALETERRQIAGERRTESILAPLIPWVGGLLLLVVLLGFCWSALVATHNSDDIDAQLNDFLIQEILPHESPTLIGGERFPSLPGRLPR